MLGPAYRKGRRALVLQQDEADCGAACLASVVRYFGGYVSVDRIRELSGTDLSGTTMLGLAQAARSLGMTAEGYEADVGTLSNLDQPSILHVVVGGRLKHFVVYFGTDRRHFVVGDPAHGVLLMSPEELKEIWASRAMLVAQPTESFIPQDQHRKARRAWFRRILLAERRLLLIAALLGVLVSLLSMAVALFSQVFLDQILPDRDLHRLIAATGLVAAFLLAQNLFAAARQLILVRQARNLNVRIMSNFVDAIVRLPFSFFALRKVGDLVARMNDTQRLQRFITLVLGEVTISVLMMVSAMLLITFYSGVIAAWCAAGLLTILTLGLLTNPALVSAQRRVMAAHAVNESCYVDSMEGIESIKWTNAEDTFAGGMRSTFTAYQQAIFQLGKLGVAYTLGIRSAGLLIIIGAIGWGASFVLAESMRPGEYVALLQMANMLVPAAYGVVLSNVQFQEAAVAFDRMYEFSSLDPEYRPERSREVVGEIHTFEVAGLAFGFPGRSALLRGIDFRLERGKLVLLKGANGTGKTTMLRILLRLFSPERGDIFVNGRSWLEISTSSWRRLVAIVPQHVEIFNGSVLDNISMGQTGDAAEVVRFCRETGLHPFIEELPSGYATILGRGGVDLSGGQRRIIGFARALYRRPRMLLLDESTAALDAEALDFVAGLISRCKASMPVLMISHHGKLQEMADHVYILEDGRTRRIS